MLINYDKESGILNFTVNQPLAPEGVKGDWLEVEDTYLGDLTSWRIFDSKLILYDLGPITREFRDKVNEERERRIKEGTKVSITNYGEVSLQGRLEDQTSLQGLAFGAQLRMSLGDNKTELLFLDKDNILHKLTPPQLLELWQKGAAFVSATYAKSWVIKELDPFSTNPSDPGLWE